MKVCVIQPKYSFEEKDIKQCFEGLLALLDKCDESMDLIVLPEYSDAPADVQGKDGFYGAVKQYNATLMQKARETASVAMRWCLSTRDTKPRVVFATQPTFLTAMENPWDGISRRIPRQAR